MRLLSGPGMVLLVFTVTFGSIDWFMSLDPEWYSTIYGLIFVASWALSALAFVIAVLGTLSKYEPVKQFRGPVSLSRSGETAVGSGNALDLFLVFAVSDHLVGKSA